MRGQNESLTDPLIVSALSPPKSIPTNSSCSQNLFLGDIFGAHQLTSFTNEEQGRVPASGASGVVMATITYTVFTTDDTNVDLDKLDIDVDGTATIIQDLDGNSITSGDLFSVRIFVEIDLDESNMLKATVSGSTALATCEATNNLIVPTPGA